jgi:hypothetical protein
VPGPEDLVSTVCTRGAAPGELTEPVPTTPGVPPSTLDVAAAPLSCSGIVPRAEEKSPRGSRRDRHASLPASGVTLGILAILGVAPNVLLSVAAIVFGASLLVGSGAPRSRAGRGAHLHSATGSPRAERTVLRSRWYAAAPAQESRKTTASAARPRGRLSAASNALNCHLLPG